AMHPDGKVYGAFYRWLGDVSDRGYKMDVIVVRDDAWGTGSFQKLMSGSKAGCAVTAAAVVVPIISDAMGAGTSRPHWFGQERLGGSNISVAVDPRQNASATVYVAWVDEDQTPYSGVTMNASCDAMPKPAITSLHVRRSTDGGATWADVSIWAS